jgi:Mn2+/Fe2+ NRAMP family transporter
MAACTPTAGETTAEMSSPQTILPRSRKPLHFLTLPAVAKALLLAALSALLVFGLIGVSVAEEFAPYHGFIWVPRLLVVVSAILIATVIGCLLRRHLFRR